MNGQPSRSHGEPTVARAFIAAREQVRDARLRRVSELLFRSLPMCLAEPRQKTDAAQVVYFDNLLSGV